MTKELLKRVRDDDVVLDFPGRIGARPYVRWVGDEWHVMSLIHAPVYDEDDDETRIRLARYPTFRMPEADVADMVDTARAVDVLPVEDTPWGHPDTIPVHEPDDWDRERVHESD